MSLVRATSMAAVLVLAAGCYRYVPAERSDVVPGAEVRARLTDTGADEVRRYLGPDIDAVDGPLVRWNSRELAVLVEAHLRRPGFPPTAYADTVRLLPQHVAGIERRELDGWRSVGLGALIAGGTVVAVFATRMGGILDSGGEDEPGQDASITIRIPVSFR